MDTIYYRGKCENRSSNYWGSSKRCIYSYDELLSYDYGFVEADYLLDYCYADASGSAVCGTY